MTRIPYFRWLAGALLWSTTVVCQNVPGVTYVDQPNGIDLAVLVRVWPPLEQNISDLRRGRTTEVRKALEARTKPSAGELNLLAQLEWQHGDLAAADTAVAKAVALEPANPLHAFQKAMIAFAHLRKADSTWQRWTWHSRTREAYQRVFALDPRNIPARYYLAYSFLNTPAIGGGSTEKALALADAGVALGQYEFYAVRADVHRVRGEKDAAIADYDRAIALKVIKLGGLLEAAEAALKEGDKERAKKYLDWAVYCRSDAGGSFEGLGDYYASVGKIGEARVNYGLAIQKDPKRASALSKLGGLSK